MQIENGKTIQVAPEINDSSLDKILDATGLTLLPKIIDPQVHFREPGLEHKEDLFTASRACCAKRIASFLEMPNTRPLTTTQATLDDKLRRAAEKCLVNYGFFIGATADNLNELQDAVAFPLSRDGCLKGRQLLIVSQIKDRSNPATMPI